jgi:protein TonB
MILTDPFPPPDEHECDEERTSTEPEDVQRATELVFAPVVVQPIVEINEPPPDDDQRCPTPTDDSSPQLAAEDQTDVPTDPITDETITNELEATTGVPASEPDHEAHRGEVARTSESASAATPAPEITEVTSASEVPKEPQEPSHAAHTSARGIQEHDPDSDSATEAEPGVRTGVEVLDLPRPRYPLMSRRRGEEGLVLLRVEVLASGRAGTIEVLRDPGFPRLTEAALQAVRKARFRAATQAGTPAKDTVQIPFRFVLE